jgi:PAS domain S-box-containing protein
MGTRLRLLILDDSADDAALEVRELARAGFEVQHERADSGPAFEGALRRGGWDVAILDYAVPGYSCAAGLEAASRLAPGLPCVVISGTIGEETAVECMRAGACDYLLKDRLARLGTVVRRALEDAAAREERGRAEARLREHALLLEAAQDIAGIGYWISGLGPDAPLEWSDRTLEIFGVPRGSFGGRVSDFVALVHPADRARVRATERAAVEEGAEHAVEYRVVRPDGAVRWVFERGRVERGADGRPVRILGVCQDVTERREREAALAESEDRYRQMFHTNQAIKLALDATDGRIVDANDAAVAFYGHPRERLLSLRISDINQAPPDELAKRFAEARAGRARFEARHRLASGEVRDMEVYTGPVTVGGRALLFSVLHDVTERNRAREALAASERKYRRIVETTREGIWVVDDRWRTTFANGRMAEMLGVRPEEMLGRRVEDFVAPDDLPQLGRNMDDRRAGEGALHDFRFVRPDGTPVWTLVSTNPFTDEAGRFDGALAMVTDVTERRRAEAMRDAQARVLGLIAGGRPLGETLAETVRMVEAADPEAMASVLLLGPDGRARTAAAGRLPAAWAASVDGLEVGPGTGSCGTAMHERRRVVVEDIASSPLWAAYREGALAHGLRACWSDPIVGSGGEVLGSFAVYSGAARAPGERELEAVAAGARLAGIAIERARSEAALRESELRLRMALQAGRMGIYDWDLGTGKITWSEEHARMWGMRLEEFDGTYAAFASRVHPDDLAVINAKVEEAMTGSGEFTHEFRVHPAPGVTSWVQGRGRFERDAAGRPTHMRGVVVDVTARREAEEAVRASEATNRALLEALPDTLFRVDREGRYLGYHSPDPSRLLVPPERFLGRTCPEVLPARLAGLFMAALGELHRTGQPQTYEYDHVRPDGSTAWWEVRLARSKGDEALCLLREVTARRTAEARLRESEQRLSLLVRSAPLGVVVFGTDFTVREWNPGAEQIFGWPAEEAVGRHGSFIVPESDRRYVDQVWNALVANRGGSRGTNRNVRRDGTTIFCEWYNATLVGPGGKVIGVACICQDVTEVRAAERRRELMMSELDHRVKNNLAAVLSLAEQTGRRAGSYPEFLEKFTGRLQAMSRMHAALAASRWRHADLGALARQTLDAYSVGPERLTVEGPAVELDPRAAQAVAMALNELATNAAKYGSLSAPAGRVSITWTVGPPSPSAEAGSVGTLHLEWRESGGPPVARPTRRGFGSEMIEGAVAHELRGTAKLDYQPSGLVCRMEVPLQPPGTGTPPGLGSLEGKDGQG